MTVQTIGAAGEYPNIASWAAAVKAASPLSQIWDGEIIDGGSLPYGASSDLNFAAVDLNTFSISLSATTNKHTGDFGTGAYVEASVGFDALYEFQNLTVNDMEFRNSNTGNFASAGKGFQTGSTIINRCLFRSTGNGTSAAGINPSGGTFRACRFEGTGAVSQGITAASPNMVMQNCSVFGVTHGMQITGTLAGTLQNTVAYGSDTADFTISVNSLTTQTNNASGDGTQPGTSGVTLTEDPFAPDGYTPRTDSLAQLVGAGVDLSITLDAANNAFAVPPSIGAYEAIGVGPTVPVLSNATLPVYTP